ncbi:MULTISPECIES: putative holin-like toxin [Bacillus]
MRVISTFQTLVLMISFASLIVSIISYLDRK